MLETFELLDRFELLHPTNSKLADLRRVYIDQDLSSLFRLTNADDELRKAILEKNIHSIFRCVNNKRIIGEIEDLRKAVVEQNLHSLFRLLHDNDDLRKAVLEDNLHSIFRLCDDDDLRKLTLENNTWKLWTILERYTNTQFVAAFKNFFVNNIEYDKDCFSRGQLKSKLWLINELKHLNVELGTVFLCAGWYATLATMIFESGMQVDKIRSFDIDPNVWKIAEVFNKPWVMDKWKFKATTKDIMSIDYNCFSYSTLRSDDTEAAITDIPNTIINTSCEHLDDFIGWYSKIPNGKLVILQANDFHDVEEHVNTYNNLDEFKASAPMSELLYAGKLELPKYTRFMLIGYR